MFSSRIFIRSTAQSSVGSLKTENHTESLHTIIEASSVDYEVRYLVYRCFHLQADSYSIGARKERPGTAKGPPENLDK